MVVPRSIHRHTTAAEVTEWVRRLVECPGEPIGRPMRSDTVGMMEMDGIEMEAV